MAIPPFPNLLPDSKPVGGRYRLLQPLGTGGFSHTFMAQDLHLPGHPLCVVKHLKPQVTRAAELQVARRLFDTEAQVLYQLGTHPQIPSLLAHFEEDQEFYLVQDLIWGHSLADEWATPTLWTEAQTITFLGDLLGILAFVHHHGVIHRDIKPSNLMRRQSDHRLVLIDFGAVKQVSTQLTAQRSSLSQTISIGTQGYMPSEQMAGRPQFSSDIYAVGILGIQALTGYPPEQWQPDPHSGEWDWRRYAPVAHPALLAVLERMVRYDFRTRYATAAEALAALQALPPQLSQYLPGESAPGAWARTNPQRVSQASQADPTVVVGGRPRPTQAAPADAPVQRRSRSAAGQGWGAVALLGMVAIGALLGMGVLSPLSPNTREDTPTTTAQSPLDTVAQAPDRSVPSPADPTPTPVQTAPAAQAEPEPAARAETKPAAATTTVPAPTQVELAMPPAVTPEASRNLTPEAAQATIMTLYQQVSNQDWEAARQQFSGRLAQQFDPSFFAQFDRVSVDNLRVTDQTADTVELVGENTYFYQDGTTQREERSFTVQAIDGQARIVASSFRRVLKTR